MLTVTCELCGLARDAVQGASRTACPTCEDELFAVACVAIVRERVLYETGWTGPDDDDSDDPDTDLFTDDGGAVSEQILDAVRTGYGMGLGGFDCDSQEGE